MLFPWVLLCLGREFPLFMTLLLVRKPGNGTLIVVIVVGDIRISCIVSSLLSQFYD